MTTLQSTNEYTVFINSIVLYAWAENSSVPVDQMSPQSCGDMAGLPEGPPCILYFRRELEAVVEKIKQVLTPAQAIQDERIRYVDTASTTQSKQELLEKSGLDIVVVLGQS